jgi:hypothetical protein
MGWSTPVRPALRGLMEEDAEFQASLGHKVRTCLKEEKKKKTLFPNKVIFQNTGDVKTSVSGGHNSVFSSRHEGRE